MPNNFSGITPRGSRAPYARASRAGSKLGPGASAFHQTIISNNFYAHDEQGDDPGQEKEGSTMSL